MSTPLVHVRHQWPVIAALARSAFRAAAPRRRSTQKPEVPSKELTATLAPRPAALVRDFVRELGGEPDAYGATVPPHLFPQWTFPLAARTLDGVPYPLARVLNAGCRMEVRAPLPAGAPLQVRAHLAGVDDDGRRAVLRQRLVTGTAETPDALVVDLYVLVPLARGGGPEKKEPPRVPMGATQLAVWQLQRDAGLRFAALTGDFNPVHWLSPYARAAGFQGPILHGFATMARTAEALNRTVFGGRTDRLGVLDVKFTRPLLLPRAVGLYRDGDRIFVGEAPGGVAYLQGIFTARAEEKAP